MSNDEVIARLEEILSLLRQDDKHVIMEERTEVEKEGSLGSNETAQESETIVRTNRVPVCDHCGRKLEQQFSVCQKDRKKLCKKCSIAFRGKIICPTDLQSVLPLSRESFKVLVVLANNIDNIGYIEALTHVQKNTIRETMRYLNEAGYIEKSGLFRVRVSELGFEAISAFGQLYSEDADMKELDRGVMEFVRERA